MTLVEHARTELERADWFDEEKGDPAMAESLVAAVAAFAEYGHSGGSAPYGIAVLERLLRLEPLGPLTSSPAEWVHICDERTNGEDVWQSSRDGSCFSENAGRTYYDIDEVLPRPLRWFEWTRVERWLHRHLRAWPLHRRHRAEPA